MRYFRSELNFGETEKNMTIPQAHYVIDQYGEKQFVQLRVQDWEHFLTEFQQLEQLLSLKQNLKHAFQEIRQIQRNEKRGTRLEDFLHEL